MKNILAFGVVTAFTLASVASADRVTPAVRAEADKLARQYVGAPCRTDYDLDTEIYRTPLSSAQIKAKRDAIYK